MTSNETLPLYVTEKDAARLLSVSTAWLRKDRCNGRTVPYFKLGKSVRYSVAALSSSLGALQEGGVKPGRK